MQLLSRHWIIRDLQGKVVTEVQKGSRGVVGCTPLIKPGDCFQVGAACWRLGGGGGAGVGGRKRAGRVVWLVWSMAKAHWSWKWPDGSVTRAWPSPPRFTIQ